MVQCFAPTDEWCPDVPIHRIMIAVIGIPCLLFFVYLEKLRALHKHFRIVRLFVLISLICQGIHAVGLPLEDPYLNSFTQSLAGIFSGWANVQWVKNMINAEAVINQGEIPVWLAPYTWGMFAANAITYPIGEFGIHFSKECGFIEFQEVMFILIIALTTIPIDVATFFVYKKALKSARKIEEAVEKVKAEQARRSSVTSTPAEPSVQDKAAQKYQVKGDQCGSEDSPKGCQDGSDSSGKKPTESEKSDKNHLLTISGQKPKKQEKEPSRSFGQRLKEAWGPENSRSANAPSRTVKSRIMALTNRSERPSGDSLEEGLRTQKAGLRKIRHMMLSFNAVMLTFVILTIWELASHALESKRDPCAASSLIGHSLYYSIWYIFQLWHTNTARHNH